MTILAPRIDVTGTLPETLATALADTFAFYLKAHIFHWNVTGPGFPQYHALFREIYEDAHGAADDLAEKIRTLGSTAPASPTALLKPSGVDLDSAACEARDMIGELMAANDVVAGSLKGAANRAQSDGEDGIVNFLQGRLERHAKWRWMLSATLDGGNPFTTRVLRTMYTNDRSWSDR